MFSLFRKTLGPPRNNKSLRILLIECLTTPNIAYLFSIFFLLFLFSRSQRKILMPCQDQSLPSCLCAGKTWLVSVFWLTKTYQSCQKFINFFFLCYKLELGCTGPLGPLLFFFHLIEYIKSQYWFLVSLVYTQ